MELEALQKVTKDIEALGASIIVISPQLEKYTQQIVKKKQLTFPVLVDKDNAVASQFGLVFTLPGKLRKLYNTFGIDLVRFNGNDLGTLPMPGRFIADSEGIIRSVDVHPDYTQRPEPSEIVNILKIIE